MGTVVMRQQGQGGADHPPPIRTSGELSQAEKEARKADKKRRRKDDQREKEMRRAGG